VDRVWTDAKDLRRHRTEVAASMAHARQTGDPDDAVIYTGQTAGLIDPEVPAAEVVSSLVADAERIISQRLSLLVAVGASALPTIRSAPTAAHPSAPLRIARIETIPLRAPPPRTFRGSKYQMSTRCTIVTRVLTDGRIVCRTEAALMPGRGTPPR
jgi:hypothetical protein